MAQFCTKCGTPLQEGVRFCTGCGATIGEPTAPAAQAPLAQVPMAQVAPTPVVAPPGPAPVAPAAAPAASSGSPILKIILAVVAVIMFLGLLSAGACVYMVYRAKQKVNQFEKQVHATFPTASGSPEVHAQPAAPSTAPGQETAPVVDTAVPVYPGATGSEGGGQMSVGIGGVKVQQYTTSDSVDKVVAFYKEKMGPTAMVTQSGGSALVQVVGSNGVVNVAITTDSSSGKTKISISSITK